MLNEATTGMTSPRRPFEGPLRRVAASVESRGEQLGTHVSVAAPYPVGARSSHDNRKEKVSLNIGGRPFVWRSVRLTGVSIAPPQRSDVASFEGRTSCSTREHHRVLGDGVSSASEERQRGCVSLGVEANGSRGARSPS